LDEDEKPEVPYGSRDGDRYQDSDGIARSGRRLPADIPKKKLVSSTFSQLDPKKQLREAGYPFDHIGTELMNLHGKFEVVSADVRVMKQEFQERTGELASKIERETNTLSARLEDARKSVLERVEALFDKKFYRVIGVIIGAVPIMYGGVVFLQQSLSGTAVAYVAVVAGIVVLVLTAIVSGRSGRQL
jgi:hypothetical protein